MNKRINVVQINMNKRREVSEQVRDFCRAQKVDVMLIQEPPVAEDRKHIPGLMERGQCGIIAER